MPPVCSTTSPRLVLQALGTVQIPDATPESELVQVLAILGALAAENDKSTLLAVLQGLSPQVLADCVISNMAHLPAASTVAGAGGSSGGLAGLMQVHCLIPYCLTDLLLLSRGLLHDGLILWGLVTWQACCCCRRTHHVAGFWRGRLVASLAACVLCV